MEYLFIYLSIFKDLFLFHVVWAFFRHVCMYVYDLHAVTTKARRGRRILWNWSYCGFCTTSHHVCLGTQPEPSAEAASDLKH